MQRIGIPRGAGDPGGYLIALLAVALAIALRLPFSAVLGTSAPFLIFIPAIILSAWRGGFWPGVLSTVLSCLVTAWWLLPPLQSLQVDGTADRLSLLLFAGVGGFVSRAAADLHVNLRQERRSRQVCELTLAAFGDAVIAVDPDDRITFMNPVAEQLTGHSFDEARAKRLDTVFQLSDGVAPQFAWLAQQSEAQSLRTNELITVGGARVPIEQRAGPIRDERGKVVGAVLTFRDITESVRAAQELRASQERVRSILDSITDAFLSVDAEWRFTYVNRAAESTLGHTREELLARNFWEAFPDLTGTAVEQSYRLAVAQQQPVRFERWYEPLNKWFEVNAYPTDVGGLAIFFRDVTLLKTSEMRDAFLVTLDDAVRPLTGAAEITQTAATMLGQHLRVNRCAYADVESDQDTFNLTGDYNDGVPSIVGRYTFTQFGTECLRLMRAALPYVVEDAETDPRTADVRLSYRATLIRSVICVPLHKSGKFVGGMAVHQTTPRRWRVDEVELVQLVANRCWESIERARVARELQEREQRFRFLAESIPQMVWTATPDGFLDYVNARGAAYFGVTEQEVRGGGWLSFVHPDDQELTVSRWRESLAGGEPYETGFRLKRGSDQTWRWHLARALAMRGRDGSVEQWFGTCTDIEDQKTTEAELMIANRGLEEFAYVASHDLQEPMRMVNSYSELLLRRVGPGVDTDMRQFAEYVQSGVKRMEKLIRDMLTYSRTIHTVDQESSGAGSLELSLRQALSLVETRMAETGATVEHDPLPMVLADETQMIHVFQNLLSNSMKYRDAARSPQIHIGASRRDGFWVISVRDNGIGFDQRYAEQVFGLFKRLHGRGQYSGTGLGLAICKRIVERYGGRMWAVSEPGTGSTFHFSLPAVDQDSLTPP